MKDLFQKLFGKALQDTEKGQPFINEPLERSDAEMEEYGRWLLSGDFIDLIKKLKISYYEKKGKTDLYGDLFYTIDKTSTKGFIVNYNNDLFIKDHFLYFFEYLRERVLEYGYYIYTSDSRSFLKEKHTELIERHYLKPKMKSENGKKVQLFGNIAISHHLINNEPVFIKFIAHNFRDRKYHPAYGYSQLEETIFH